MHKRIAGLLGGVAALATFNGAQAAHSVAPNQGSLNVQSYAELLDPISNAVPLLIADDAARAQQRSTGVRLAQYHHHHHQFGGFGFGADIGPPPGYYGPDCYIQRQVVVNRWGQRVVRRVRVCD